MFGVSFPQLRGEVCQLLGCYAKNTQEKEGAISFGCFGALWFKVGSAAEMKDCGAEYQLPASEL